MLDVIVAVIQEIKMGKKLKALAGNLADNQFAHTVKGPVSVPLPKPKRRAARYLMCW